MKHNANKKFYGVLKKIKNVGTSDPFVARMMLGIFEIRNFIYLDEATRFEFDKVYTPALDNLFEAKEAKEKCIELVEKHSKNVSEGKVVSWQHNTLQVDEHIDDDLNKNFKDFFIKGEIALHIIDTLARFMDFGFSFFFKNDGAFHKGLRQYRIKHSGEKHQAFIKMLESDRFSWYDLFNQIRNDIEHKSFKLPETKYRVNQDKKVSAVFPLIQTKSISEFLQDMWVNLFEFSEDVIIYMFDSKLQPPLKIGIIPENQREKEIPKKYVVTADLPLPNK